MLFSVQKEILPFRVSAARRQNYHGHEGHNAENRYGLSAKRNGQRHGVSCEAQRPAQWFAYRYFHGPEKLAHN